MHYCLLNCDLTPTIAAELYIKHPYKHLQSIWNNSSHPLQGETAGALGSSFSHRLLHPHCKKEH